MWFTKIDEVLKIQNIHSKEKRSESLYELLDLEINIKRQLELVTELLKIYYENGLTQKQLGLLNGYAYEISCKIISHPDKVKLQKNYPLFFKSQIYSDMTEHTRFFE